MTEEEQEKLYKLLFKDTKNKLEETIEKLRIANAELRDELDKKNSEIKEQQNKIKELENADLTTVYMNGFYDGEKKWKDKIKEKIKELKEGE